jgi:hypothetical protein
LTCDLTRVLVAKVAPEECVVFPVLSRAYFTPGGKGREDEELGFGDAEAVTLLTPVVMAAVDGVTQELIADLIHDQVVRGISEARAALRRLFRLERRAEDGGTGKPDEPLLRLSTEQWARIHRLAIEIVRHEGGTQEVAERVANALVVAGQGMLGQEQP